MLVTPAVPVASSVPSGPHHLHARVDKPTVYSNKYVLGHQYGSVGIAAWGQWQLCC